MNSETKKNISRWLLDIIFPNRCPICEEIILWNERICNECRNHLEYVIDGTVCRGCGKAECICNNKLYYDGAIVLCYYYGRAKKGIYSLKINSSIKYFGEFLGEELAKKIMQEIEYGMFDFIVPVPISKSRLKKRGFNQSAIIGEEIGKALNIPVYDDILIKNELSKEQHTFKTRDERIKNAEKLFDIKEIDLSEKNIILCDDIITTGSTINKCAEILKHSGAETVFAVLGTTTQYKADTIAITDKR